MIDSGQMELGPTPVELLDESIGVIPYAIADLPRLDPEKRITLGKLARRYGAALAPLPAPQAATDPALGVGQAERSLATPKKITRGLYIDRSDPRYEDAISLVKLKRSAGIRIAEDMGLVLPFKVDHQHRNAHPGVVFPPDEFDTVGHSAAALVSFTRTRTQKANQAERNRAETRQTVDRSGGHIMKNYIEKMNALEAEYISDHDLMVMLHGQATGAAAYAHYKDKNLERAMKRADEMFHETVETAALNNIWPALAVNGVHRAITFSLHRRGTSRDVRHAWQRMTVMQGLYINSRRFKLIQSRTGCESYLERYKPALDLKAAQEAEAADRAA